VIPTPETRFDSISFSGVIELCPKEVPERRRNETKKYVFISMIKLVFKGSKSEVIFEHFFSPSKCSYF
jgi:hypothetical protein